MSEHCFPHDSLAHVSCLFSVIYYDMDFIRLDYKPLFRKMSPHSSPERETGRVRFPLLV